MTVCRLLLALLVPAVLHAQGGVTARARMRAAPDGRVLATIEPSATLRPSTSRAGFTQVVLEGYLHRSVVGGRRDGFSRSVNARSGALLRAAPRSGGRVVARLQHAIGLQEVSRRGEWVRVRRTGWVSSPLVRRAPAGREESRAVAAAPRPPAAQGSEERATPATRSASEGARAESETAVSAGAVETPARDEGAAVQPEMAPARRITIASAPDGEALATIDSGVRLTPLSRDRGWVRVQMEGWVREADLAPADSSVVASLSAADVRADPSAARGKLVRWEVQVLSLQYADALRRDLERDEPYLLARGPRGENALLYLALPLSLVERARKIPPLSSLVVTARVRVARSEPAGVPILDVQSLAQP